MAEALQNALARTPGSAEAWVHWADFDLERFRVLQLKLRSAQSGMAVVLRLQAQGLHSGPETREELLRQSATADSEQHGIWGELGVEQVRRGMLGEAAAALKTAQERQPKYVWTLRLEAMMAAARRDWKEAESRLLVLGGRSPAMLREELQAWPRNLVPPNNVAAEIWKCLRENSAACVEKLKFPGGEIHDSEEQLFADERWERLSALPEPPSEVPAAWFRRGVALAEMKDCPRAIPALERGLAVGAKAAAYWLELCYASEAERAVARLGELGNQATFHRVRGDFLVRVKGDMQAGTEEYVKARKLQPRDPLLAERLAQACENIGDMQRAKSATREALALDPRRVVSLRLLASIAMNERDYASALESLNKLLALQPDIVWTRMQLGIAYAQTGRPQEALTYLQPALAAGYPDERGALHAMLAGVLRKLGREQEAQSAAAESTRLSNLFQQHGQGPASPPEERR
ncbi:MAG TPA: tetratricopeptide repeat protein [Candidatus Acidoferrum sp.]|nr:tetratricopeptide repeat protein [Candidatus Acidoferrum sp.]